MSSIAERIDLIVSTFQKGRELEASASSIDELISDLNKIEPRYRSVGFEGASMGIAISKKFDWAEFHEKADQHSTQIHIGLGWAIGEQDWNVAESLESIDPEMHAKVLDGVGYWFGLFRRRLTIRTQGIPEQITAEFQSGFDNGVGRSIWYISKGDPEMALKIINSFPEERIADLWFGIGVASTYVGGCSEDLTSELKALSSVNSDSFDGGIASAKTSLTTAGN